jgi:hypothetical protein
VSGSGSEVSRDPHRNPDADERPYSAFASESRKQLPQRSVNPFRLLLLAILVTLIAAAGAVSTRESLDSPKLVFVAGGAGLGGALLARLILWYATGRLDGVRTAGPVWFESILAQGALGVLFSVLIHLAVRRIFIGNVEVVVSGYAALMAIPGVALNVPVASRWGTPTNREVAPVLAQEVGALLDERLFGGELDNYEGWIVAEVEVMQATATTATQTQHVSAWLQPGEPPRERLSSRRRTICDRVVVSSGRPALHASFTLALVGEEGARAQRVVQTSLDDRSESANLETAAGDDVLVYVSQGGRTVQILSVNSPPPGRPASAILGRTWWRRRKAT